MYVSGAEFVAFYRSLQHNFTLCMHVMLFMILFILMMFNCGFDPMCIGTPLKQVAIHSTIKDCILMIKQLHMYMYVVASTMSSWLTIIPYTNEVLKSKSSIQ